MSLLERVERAQRGAARTVAPVEGDGSAPPSDGQAAPAASGAAAPVGPPPAATTSSPTGSAPAGSPTRPQAPARPQAAARPTLGRPATSPAREAQLAAIRSRVQASVVGAFRSLIEVSDQADMRARITDIVDRVIADNSFALTRDERLAIISEVIDEVTGLGPLEPLLADPAITEIMVNGPEHIYVERRGKIERVDVQFLNDEHVERIIDRIIAPIGRHIDESSPRVDARLPDGSRVNAIIAPLSLIGPVITIRRFSATPFTVEDLVRFGTATPEMFDFIRACVWARLNVFVSGGTGSGKTTLLNVLSSFIPEDDRIVTIEDAAELQLNQEHVVTLEARPPNSEGLGEISIRDLLRNALHMRPDRIIVGECRSGEALDMVQAMTTGQDGSLSTGHANSPRDMLRRLETMILMAGYDLPLRAIREQITSAVDLIVHTARLRDGSRKITAITEVYGIEDDEILTQDIFVFEQTGVVDGKVVGELRPTGIRPTFMGVFKSGGIPVPADEWGIPSEADAPPPTVAQVKTRFGLVATAGASTNRPTVGVGRAIKAGGMVYVSSVGPIDPATDQVVLGGIKEQARQCIANLRARLAEHGSALDKLVWANWALREPIEFDEFIEEWQRALPGESPVGQTMPMPIAQRRAGFRVSIGAIAEA